MDNAHVKRAACWHPTETRIAVSGRDDHSLSFWRLYNERPRPVPKSKEAIQMENNDDLDDDSDDDDAIVERFDPTLRHLEHLVSFPTTGSIQSLCFSPDGSILVGLSSLSYNHKSCADIYHVPDWIANHTERKSPDFTDTPRIVPLPYGSVERACVFINNEIALVGLLSCRSKHKKRYCPIVAIHAKEYAVRTCSKMNRLFRRKEYATSMCLSATKNRLAVGCNSGRILVFTLKKDLNWDTCRDTIGGGFVQSVSVALDPAMAVPKQSGTRISLTKPRNHGRKRTSTRFMVLSARERSFRDVAQTLGGVSLANLESYLKNLDDSVERKNVVKFFQHMSPDHSGLVSFSKFVKIIDEDGDVLKAFRNFTNTGISRTYPERNETASDYDGDTPESDDDEKSNHRHHNPATGICFSDSDEWIFSGHANGEVRFWEFRDGMDEEEKETEPNPKKLKRDRWKYVCNQTIVEHADRITSICLSQTYLISSGADGRIFIWFLEFLVPSSHFVSVIGSDVIQILARIEEAHLGEEVSQVSMSPVVNNVHHCVPPGLYLLSCGGDGFVRCHELLDVFRQELTVRALKEAEREEGHSRDRKSGDSNSSGSTAVLAVEY